LLHESRTDIPIYRDYLDSVRSVSSSINERFGDGSWQPVDLRIEDNFAEVCAAYKQFDVLLVNSVFDGMNLVVKEAVLLNERAGAVVLSENTGAYEEIGDWAISVNPFDVDQQAEALREALRLPRDERAKRIDAIAASVRAHPVAEWVERQIDELETLRR